MSPSASPSRAPDPARPWQRLLGPLAWGAYAALAGIATATLDPNVLEEGIVVHTAERMLAGEHLFRDVWIHTGPLPYELLALLFRGFGAHLLLARGTVVAFHVVATALAFCAARRAHAGAGAHLVAALVGSSPVFLIPLYSLFFYTTLAWYLGLVTVYVALRAVEPGARTGFALASGVLIAAVALTKQSTGVVFAAALLPAMALAAPAGGRGRPLAAVLAGGVAVAGVTLLLYGLRGDLGDFVYCQVRLPLELGGNRSFRTPYVNLWPPGRFAPEIQDNWVMYLPSVYHIRHGLFAVLGMPIVLATQALYALPFVAVAATAAGALLGRRHPLLWIHGAFLVAMAANLYPRADWGHLVVALPPSLVQLVLVTACRREPAPEPRPLLQASAVTGVLLVVGSCALTGRWLHDISGEATFGPRVPLHPVSRAYRGSAVPRVVQYLRAHTEPGQPVFVARQEPLLYFATETTNPTPFEGVLPGIRDVQQQRILAALPDVRFVVMSDIDQPHYTYYADELPDVWAAFERYYEVPRNFLVDDYSWIVVGERSRDRGPTAVDLTALRSGARAFTRQRDGTLRPHPGTPARPAAKQFHRFLPFALGPGGGGLDFDVAIPAGAVFRAGVGFRYMTTLDQLFEHPKHSHLVVSFRPEGADDFELLREIEIDDGPAAGRRWRPVEIDLSERAGQSGVLRLELRAHQPLPAESLAWWGSPRITVAPAAAGHASGP